MLFVPVLCQHKSVRIRNATITFVTDLGILKNFQITLFLNYSEAIHFRNNLFVK